MTALADRLTRERPCRARAFAACQLLLGEDPESPLFGADEQGLRLELRRIAWQLDADAEER